MPSTLANVGTFKRRHSSLSGKAQTHAGATITLASPKGGQPPLDPKSDAPDTQTDDARRFKGNAATQAALTRTAKLGDLIPNAGDTVFFPGGHGPLWDLAEDADSIHLIQHFAASGRPVAAVCHAPAIFRHTRCVDVRPLVTGQNPDTSKDAAEALVKLLGRALTDAE